VSGGTAAIESKLELDGRLNGYFATLRASSFGDALKRSVENWQIYAAVTGSVAAMATNASAGVIYSGPVNVKASVASVQTGSAAKSSVKNIQLKNSRGSNIGVGFGIEVFQENYGFSFKFAGAALKGSEVDFLLSQGSVKRLSSGAKISGGGHTVASHNGFVAGNKIVAGQQSSSGIRMSQGWAKNKGFAGFSFKTANPTVVNHQTDFGWVRLQFTVGANTLINSLTVIDWGYQSNGTGITAGNEGGPLTAPEPSTSALTLLAAGATGVAALRRRRKASA
jgi:hypothetical protein